MKTVDRSVINQYQMASKNPSSERVEGVIPYKSSPDHNHTVSHAVYHAYDHIHNMTKPSALPIPNGNSEDKHTHVLAYVLVPLGSLVFIALLSFLVVMILRKSRLDKLRHHLMPLYNFDPAEEGVDDWESELLEEDKDQQVTMRLTGPSPTGGPKLKFTADSLEL